MFQKNIAIIGSSGAIGGALLTQLAESQPETTLHAFARQPSASLYENVHHHIIDYREESALAKAAHTACEHAPLDLILVTTGLLHHKTCLPEKSLRDLSAEKFQRLFEVNTILPALVAKHFLPKISKDKRAVFAALSARVGSISDNRLGGWYAYRASKAALNMIIKNISIEMSRCYKHAIIVGLHPGTVDSPLSKPFQSRVPEGNLFTPEYSAQKLLSVLDHLKIEDSGKCFAWDGTVIPP